MLISVYLVAPTLDHVTLLLKRRVECHRARFETQLLDKRACLGRAVLAVHTYVFPLDAQRALVADVIQRDDDFLEVDVAVAEAAEIPVTARVAEVRMSAEHAHRAVTVAPPHVLHVDMVNAVAKAADELH